MYKRYKITDVLKNIEVICKKCPPITLIIKNISYRCNGWQQLIKIIYDYLIKNDYRKFIDGIVDNDLIDFVKIDKFNIEYTKFLGYMDEDGCIYYIFFFRMLTKNVVNSINILKFFYAIMLKLKPKFMKKNIMVNINK